MATMARVNLRHSMYRLNGRPTSSLKRWAKRPGERCTLPAAASSDSPETLRRNVTSPGGTTHAAMTLIEARAVQERDVPMVVRIVGTNAAEAAVLLEEAHFATAASLAEAAAKAVAASRGAAA